MPVRLVEDIRQEIRDGSDPLGDLLCALRPATTRRDSGAFYTPPVLVAAMTAWLLAHPLDRVVDAGCGSGRFALAVARQRPDMAIIAIDSDPLATLLTRAALATVGVSDVRILHHDYLTLMLPPVAGSTGFIANPPYVRHHQLSAQTKAWATIAGAFSGIQVSGLSGLHTLFFLATALNARPGDVGCFITSAEWLDTRYGAAIRHLLTERLGLRMLALLDPRAIPFADAMTTAVITGFVAGFPSEQIGVRLSETPESLRLDAETTIDRERLRAAARWGPFLRRAAPTAVAGQPDTSPVSGYPVPLRTIARVHRGVATGSNRYFVLTRDRATQLGLLPWCRSAITRAEEILHANGHIHDGPERKLPLVVPRYIDRRAHPALNAYLRLGEQSLNGATPASHGYLARHRSPWWYLGPVAAAPIVVSYMARQAPVFAYNPDGLVLLNIAHGIHPHKSMNAAQLLCLVAQLNAARASFSGRGRTYHGGLEKFEPGEMEQLPLERFLRAAHQ